MTDTLNLSFEADLSRQTLGGLFNVASMLLLVYVLVRCYYESELTWSQTSPSADSHLVHVRWTLSKPLRSWQLTLTRYPNL